MDAYIIDSTTGEKLQFQYAPKSLRDSRTPDYAESTVVGQSHAQVQFVSGGTRTLQFTLEFHWETRQVEVVHQRIEWLKSLTYPDNLPSGEMRSAPHPVLLMMGQLYKSEVWVVRRVEPTYADLWDEETQYPLVATVEVELSELPQRSVNYQELRLPEFAGQGSAQQAEVLGEVSEVL